MSKIFSVLVELASPQSVNGKRVSYQSLWLLVRLFYGVKYGQDRLVRLTELHGIYRDARSLRMVVSRAFRDFAAWGVQAGWGEDTQRNPLYLNADGRSQGPFWLNDEQVGRICCVSQGECADQSVLEAFLGVSGNIYEGATAVNHALYPLTFWGQLLSAQRDMHCGRWRAEMQGQSPMTSGALAGFRQAARIATDPFQHALAVLGEAGVWRRLDDPERAQTVLHELQMHLDALPMAETGYIVGMRQIMMAWAAYSQREYSRALAQLQKMLQTEPSASICRYNPRIRFEWNNLAALIYRAQAMEKSNTDLSERILAAGQALEYFTTALYAAFEGNTFDLAQHVAANIGFTLWLCNKEGVLDCPDDISAETIFQRAVQWVGLSEALSVQAGNPGFSVWNLIYLLRMARSRCPLIRMPSAEDFRTYQLYSPVDIAAMMGPFSACLVRYHVWMDVIDTVLDAHERHQRYLNHSQWVNLCYEKTWLLTHSGEWEEAARMAQQIRLRLRYLPVADRQFFRQAMKLLPREVEQ